MRETEKGNALFLILIAVALFAALSYAVTQSGRGGGTIDKEQQLIDVAQVMNYPNMVRSAVTRMVLTGTALSSLDFTSAGTGDDAVFDTAGGGVTWEEMPPIKLHDPAAAPTNLYKWAYGDGAIEDIGSTADDKLIHVIGFSLAVCNAINKQLGLSYDPPVSDANTGDGWNAYPGEEIACFRDAFAMPHFYMVLVAQ